MGKEQLDRIEDNIEKIFKTLHGTDGLVVRCDRNTSFRKALLWIIGSIFGSGIVVTITVGLIKYYG